MLGYSRFGHRHSSPDACWSEWTQCVHSLAVQRRDKCKDAASRFLGQCAILGSATGTCCASGGALWLEVEAPSLPNRCLHLAQTAGAGLKFEGALFSVQPLAPLHLPMVRAEVPVPGTTVPSLAPTMSTGLVYSRSATGASRHSACGRSGGTILLGTTGASARLPTQIWDSAKIPVRDFWGSANIPTGLDCAGLCWTGPLALMGIMCSGLRVEATL